ncbi:MAG: hypothetical protein IPP08_12200 [Chlorobiota bacterium]|nr:hypothetical protein [Chlorobiota bacterium]QQS66500.1 MAG: hypothetical protein IPP08_12200 [Chlorobiota bacterium]
MIFRFLRILLPVTILMALLLVYPLFAWTNPEQTKAIIASGIISFVNIFLGMLSIEFSMDKSTQVFMNSVFGGMVLRMFLVLGVMFALILLGFDKLSLALSLMGFYVVYVIMEITYVVKELDKRNAESKRKSTNPVYKAIKKMDFPIE